MKTFAVWVINLVDLSKMLGEKWYCSNASWVLGSRFMTYILKRQVYPLHIKPPTLYLYSFSLNILKYQPTKPATDMCKTTGGLNFHQLHFPKPMESHNTNDIQSNSNSIHSIGIIFLQISFPARDVYGPKTLIGTTELAYFILLFPHPIVGFLLKH